MTDSLPLSEYHQRRQQLLAHLPPCSAVLLPAATLRYRNRDAEYAFRQSSDFLYLSGFAEPDALLLLLKNADAETESMLFVSPRDPAQEIWTGYRAGAEGAVAQFGFDRGFSLQEQAVELPGLLAGCERIYYPFSEPMSADGLAVRIQAWCQQLQARGRSSEQAPQQLHNIEPLLHQLRLIKSDAEQQQLRLAAQISARAHRRAMRSCAPGVFEYQLEADIIHSFGQQGCRFAAYGTIVGGGANGCILHYTENGDALRDGDLVLIDAGCEHEGYAGDITRTFPVNGCFSADQRSLYQCVLNAQQAAIEAVRPGVCFDAPHQAALQVLVAGLVELGLLEGEVEALIVSEAYKPFYMHRTSHWLGLDVHDVGDYRRDGESRLLEAGMVLTIEPGLYVAPDNAQVDARWRGMGIRIEDDLLVTEQGYEVLSVDAPKQIAEIEALMALSRTPSRAQDSDHGHS
ncbi:MAG: Xaa-Pro aminopeptidase [Motiliproteus sp.]|jgi:Xaa-Pro aminopeptidase